MRYEGFPGKIFGASIPKIVPSVPKMSPETADMVQKATTIASGTLHMVPEALNMSP